MWSCGSPRPFLVRLLGEVERPQPKTHAYTGTGSRQKKSCRQCGAMLRRKTSRATARPEQMTKSRSIAPGLWRPSTQPQWELPQFRRWRRGARAVHKYWAAGVATSLYCDSCEESVTVLLPDGLRHDGTERSYRHVFSGCTCSVEQSATHAGAVLCVTSAIRKDLEGGHAHTDVACWAACREVQRLHQHHQSTSVQEHSKQKTSN